VTSPARRPRIALIVALLLLLTAAPAAARTTAEDLLRPGGKPDIVLLVLDDVGPLPDAVWERLPTIRRLFLEGSVRLTRHVGNDPLCCPGRATLLTGLRARDHGVVANDGRLFDPTVTIATELADVGYRTGLFGKYLNMEELLADKTPPGWNRFFMGIDYYRDTWWDDGEPFWIGDRARDYSVDVLRRTAVRWLGKVPREEPFFAYLSPYTIHAGTRRDGSYAGDEPVPAPRHEKDPRCRDLEPWRTPAHGTLPAPVLAWMAGMDTWRRSQGRPLTEICEALLGVDDLVSALEARLAAEGRKDVVWILTADNGMSWGRFGWERKHVPWAAGLPLFIHAPGGSAGEPRSIVSTTTSTDIAPTICDLAGCAMGPFPSGKLVSGRSILPLLHGEVEDPPREVIPTEQLTPWTQEAWMPPWQGLVTTEASPLGRWSYVRYVTGDVWMADLEADPWELVNLAADPAHRETRRALEALWEELHPPRH